MPLSPGQGVIANPAAADFFDIANGVGKGFAAPRAGRCASGQIDIVGTCIVVRNINVVGINTRTTVEGVIAAIQGRRCNRGLLALDTARELDVARQDV